MRYAWSPSFPELSCSSSSLSTRSRPRSAERWEGATTGGNWLRLASRNLTTCVSKIFRRGRLCLRVVLNRQLGRSWEREVTKTTTGGRRLLPARLHHLCRSHHRISLRQHPWRLPNLPSRLSDAQSQRHCSSHFWRCRLYPPITPSTNPPASILVFEEKLLSDPGLRMFFPIVQCCRYLKPCPSI